MRVLRPLTSKATYRRWVYLVLGGAISVPYLLFAVVAVPSVLPFVATLEQAVVAGGLLTLAVLAGTAFLPAVHVLESTAIRELLDDPVPDAPAKPHTRRGRLHAATMFLLHVVAGLGVSFFSLAAPVAIGVSISAVFTGYLMRTVEGRTSPCRRAGRRCGSRWSSRSAWCCWSTPSGRSAGCCAGRRPGCSG